MNKWIVVGAMFAGCVVAMAGLGLASPPDDTVKKVMKDAMKSGLYKKVVTGKATGDEKKDLLSLLETLVKGEPPEGDDASWKTKTNALTEAAKAVAEDKPDASAKLKTAGDCKSCHDVHKAK